MQVIDRLRHDIQHRLEQLLAEADKLRHALAALDPREDSTASRAQPDKPAPPAKRTVPKASSSKPSATRKRPASPTAAAGTPGRTPPGATRAKVLGALSRDQPLTAGEVSKATGLARPTVSTTLSKLAKSGEVVKAARGYNLPNGTAAAGDSADHQSESANAEA